GDTRAEDVVDERNQHEWNGGDDRGHGEHAGEQVDPPCEPRVRAVRQVLGPLIDRSRDREVRADLGEVEADDQLSDDDDRPAPVEESARQRDAEDEQSEDTRGRRDVRESDGEAGVDAEDAAELLLVAEASKVTYVSLVCLFLQGYPSPNLKRAVQVARKLPLVAQTVNGRAGRNGRPARPRRQRPTAR